MTREHTEAVIKDLQGKVCAGCKDWKNGNCENKNDYCYTKMKIERLKKKQRRNDNEKKVG
jgi:hypothetical protein